MIMNLTDMDDADAKRLVDFAAGLVFGLHGAIERVTEQGVPALARPTSRSTAEEAEAAQDGTRLLQPELTGLRPRPPGPFPPPRVRLEPMVLSRCCAWRSTSSSWP